MAKKATEPEAPQPSQAEPEAPKAPVGKAVKMRRDAEIYPAPHVADVHPDEVESYRVGGWEVVK